MHIRIDKNVVDFEPETPHETASLELLWRKVVDCARENKKMVAIGEYIPQSSNVASFFIEGIKGGKTEYSEEKATEDGAYYCDICNKYMNAKKGDALPFCCGKVMENLD